MKKITYYKCFSIPMLRFLKANGQRAVSKSVHQNGKTFWVFEMTDELSRLLKIWTENKK